MSPFNCRTSWTRVWGEADFPLTSWCQYLPQRWVLRAVQKQLFWDTRVYFARWAQIRSWQVNESLNASGGPIYRRLKCIRHALRTQRFRPVLWVFDGWIDGWWNSKPNLIPKDKTLNFIRSTTWPLYPCSTVWSLRRSSMRTSQSLSAWRTQGDISNFQPKLQNYGPRNIGQIIHWSSYFVENIGCSEQRIRSKFTQLVKIGSSKSVTFSLIS